MKHAIWAAALLLAVPTAASAATIITPMIEHNGNTSSLRCFAVNTGKKQVDVTMTLRSNVGTVVGGPNVTSVLPGQAKIVADNILNTEFFAYCVVEGKFAKKSMRVSLCALPSGTFDCVGTVVGE